MFEKQIEKGVSLLDRIRPNWIDKMPADRAHFDMAYAFAFGPEDKCCVMAHIWGNSDTGAVALGLLYDTSYEAINHGFAVPTYLDCQTIHEKYNILTQEWWAVIEARRQAS